MEERIVPSKNSSNTLASYKFFKFFKPCGLECNLNVQVQPLADKQQVFSILVNYQSERELSQGGVKLPVWNNDPMWSANLMHSAALIISGSEPEFFEDNNGKDKQE